MSFSDIVWATTETSLFHNKIDTYTDTKAWVTIIDLEAKYSLPPDSIRHCAAAFPRHSRTHFFNSPFA